MLHIKSLRLRLTFPTPQWPFPLFSMRASTKSLEAALDPAEAAQMGDGKLAERVGYWYKPASRQMQEDDARPVSPALGHEKFISCLTHALLGTARRLPRHQRDIRHHAVPSLSLEAQWSVFSRSSMLLEQQKLT